MEEPGLSCVQEFVMVRSVVVPELMTSDEMRPVCQPVVKRFVVVVVPAASVTAIELVSPAVLVIWYAVETSVPDVPSDETKRCENAGWSARAPAEAAG